VRTQGQRGGKVVLSGTVWPCQLAGCYGQSLLTRHGWDRLCVWGESWFNGDGLGLDYVWKGMWERLMEVWNGKRMMKNTN